MSGSSISSSPSEPARVLCSRKGEAERKRTSRTRGGGEGEGPTEREEEGDSRNDGGEGEGEGGDGGEYTSSGEREATAGAADPKRELRRSWRME
jgi:hypothetical protein